MTKSQPVPEQQSWNLELMDFANLVKFTNKTELLEKFKLLIKEYSDSQNTRREKKTRILSLPPTSIYKCL